MIRFTLRRMLTATASFAVASAAIAHAFHSGKVVSVGLMTLVACVMILFGLGLLIPDSDTLD